MIADMSTHTFRQSVLDDLYDASRLVDKLDNIHFFARPMVANDMSTSIMLDINTAYASLVGTSKHVISSISAVSNVKTVHQLCSIIAGSDKNFFDKPFMSLNVNHVVPPLRFDTESCEVLIEASRFGFPVMVNTFGQMGASSPVTIAGCLVQTNAETLAGMVLAWLANKDVNAIYGARPMVTDLRTGGMAGGSGEQSLLTAAAVQLAQYYNFPNSTISGATDSKLPDNQAGYEKAINLTLAVQTGANLITQAAGTQAGLMATSLEAYVIDNEMLGAILSTGKQIEVNEETCSVEAIKKVVEGDGHFLGQAATFNRMSTDFVYPEVADRQAYDSWVANGKPNINSNAKTKVEAILREHKPNYIPKDCDTQIRKLFDIRIRI